MKYADQQLWTMQQLLRDCEAHVEKLEQRNTDLFEQYESMTQAYREQRGMREAAEMRLAESVGQLEAVTRQRDACMEAAAAAPPPPAIVDAATSSLLEQLEAAQHRSDENRQIIESERDYIWQLKEQYEEWRERALRWGADYESLNEQLETERRTNKALYAEIARLPNRQAAEAFGRVREYVSAGGALCGDPCPEAPDLDFCLLPKGHDGEWHKNRSSSWPVSTPASVPQDAPDFVPPEPVKGLESFDSAHAERVLRGIKDGTIPASEPRS